MVGLGIALAACGSDDADTSSSGTGGGGAGGAAGVGGAAGAAAGGLGGGAAGAVAAPTCDEIQEVVDAYKVTHPGKDGDINQKTPAEISLDPTAQKLLAMCGSDQRPIYPLLAWEYGGNDHAWINPQASAAVYCVYTPVVPSTANWQYDAAADHVTADVYLPCPEQNPCKDEVDADQVLACLGDDSNIEILVDTASLNDGIDVGLLLSEASTDLNLILPDGGKVHLYTGL